MYLKIIVSSFLFICVYWTQIHSQCTRSTTLSRSIIYNTEGSAFLEELDDGSVQLRLGTDFFAERGPDVNIFLTNDSTSVIGGFLVADISEISHFSGAITFEIEEDLDINDYTFVVFRCLLFDAYWGGGRLSSCGDDPDGGNMGSGEMEEEAMCFESLVATTAWVAEVTVCPNDGVSDFVPFMNNAFIPVGEAYAYILTDIDTMIQEVILANNFDFEGSSLETQFIFGVSYQGELNYTAGQHLNTITASECVIISDTSIFLTILKEDCASSSSFTLSGMVTFPSGDPIMGVEITDEQGSVIAMTNEQGEYTIESAEQGMTYLLRPRSTTSLTNGVSTLDVVIIARHLLDTQPFTDPYLLIAADINNSNSISSVDLVQMIRAIVGLSEEFINNVSWRFIDASQKLSIDQMNPSLREEISITVTDDDVTGVNFIGVKIGDVNSSADLNLR